MEAELFHADGQRDMTMPKLTFRNFADALKTALYVQSAELPEHSLTLTDMFLETKACLILTDTQQQISKCVVSGFRLAINEISAHLGC